MDDLYMELFKAMSQFRKLHISDLMPGISHAEFFTLNCIMETEEGRINISNLAQKSRVLPSAISRTLRGLEEQHYVVRSVDPQDRRNTYVALTEAGCAITLQSRKIMADYGKAVVSHLDEAQMIQLINYLNEIYNLSKIEIEARKVCSRKGKKDEKNI